MQLGKSILIIVFLALFYLPSSKSQVQNQLDNWLEFCPFSQFCFDRPKNLLPTEVLIIDSITGQLENENMTLTYDLGLYASTFRELSGASSETVKVDGHDGKILIQKNKMALTIATVSGKAGFSMLIEFKNSIKLEQGRRIFKSIKFNLKQ